MRRFIIENAVLAVKVFSGERHQTISVGPHSKMYGTGEKVFVADFKVLYRHYSLAEE
jgi:hypothetical protein